MTPTLFIDLDGTLVRCHEYYTDIVDQFATRTARRTQVEYAVVREFAKDIDLLAALRATTFSKERFPGSLAAASIMADVLAGRAPDWAAAAEMQELGHRVYRAPYPAYPGVLEVLRQYQQAGWQLVLLTKGDDEVQLRKVHGAGLDEIFDPEHVAIVRRKDVANLQTLLDWYHADAQSTWVIGDSLRDDIVPAQRLGVGTVYIQSREPWAYDRDEAQSPTHCVNAFTELPTVVPLELAYA